MKLPTNLKEFKGRNRIRDFAICVDYIKGKKPEEIINERKLSICQRRVEQIIYENKDFVNANIAWPKSRRIWELQRAITNAPETKKDKADLLEQLRGEIEGDKAKDQSTNTNIILIRVDGNKTQNVAGQVHLQPEEISRDVQLLGDGEINEPDFPSHVIQRAYPG